MKKTLVFASMMLAALAASAAAVTHGPEPNKQVFASERINDSQMLSATNAPAEPAVIMQSAGFKIKAINASDLNLTNKKPHFGSELTLLVSKVLDGSAFASMSNPRELHPAEVMKA